MNANPTKWSNTLKQFVGNLPTNCLSVFDHFMGLALKGLKKLGFFSLTLWLFFFNFFTLSLHFSFLCYHFVGLALKRLTSTDITSHVPTKNIDDVILNKFYLLLWSLHWWLWTSQCRLDLLIPKKPLAQK